jgi:hypothetical protein
MPTREQLMRLLAKVGLILAGVAPVSFAQGPIRVETNQVLVPTVVFDKKLYAHEQDLQSRVEKDPHFWDTIAIRDLVASDFHLSEDGQDQTIVSVKLEAPTSIVVEDNLGRHTEKAGSGGGRWVYPDIFWGLSIGFPHYVIGYLPPHSPPGSCHQVRVSVGRPNLVVWARSEYCNTEHPPSDPLNGTEFGLRMEREFAEPTEGNIDVTLQALAFRGVGGTSRANISLEFSPNALKHEFKDGRLYATIGVFGKIYSQDGAVVKRFSDFACCDYGNEKKSFWNAWSAGPRGGKNSSMLPYRYDQQIDLATGEYVVEVLLSDGEHFGRRKVSLRVEDFAASQLSISEVALCERVRKMPTDPADVPAALSGRYIPLVSNTVEFVPDKKARLLKFPGSQNLGLYFYFEIYAPQTLGPTGAGPTGAGLQAHLRVVNPRTGEIKINSQAIDLAPYLNPGSPFVFVGRGVRLDSLDVGSYEMEVQATDSSGHSTPWKEAAFTVEQAPRTLEVVPRANQAR